MSAPRQPGELLAQYDAQMRRDAPADPGFRQERRNGVLRVIGPDSWIVWWEFGEAECDAAVAAEAAAFRTAGRDVEWKVYGHDAPPNLRATLERHGFIADEPETFMLLDLAAAPDGGGGSPVPGCVIRRVSDERGLSDLVRVTGGAFDCDASWMMHGLPPQIFAADPRAAAFVAYVDGVAAGGGRLEFPRERAFAGLWGGCTTRPYRGRGIFRALVAMRAAFARASGYSYLTVDAQASSRPIFERCGFVALTHVAGWNLNVTGARETSRIPAESERA